MTLEAGKEMDRRCVLGWLNEVYRNPAVAFNTYSDEQQIEFAHDALVLLLEKENKNHMNDPVNHPSHYTQGNIECIDFITDKKLNFCRGNAVKYIVRAGLKDPTKEIEDLEKAIFYINREIQDLRQHSNT